MTSPAVLLTVLWLFAPQANVIDLTSATVQPEHWRIVSSRSGGPIATWPLPAAHAPVAVHITDLAAGNGELRFSLVIHNDRQLKLEVPVSTDSTRFDGAGTIHFRQVLIQLGVVADTGGHSVFRNDPNLDAISLFGHSSVPDTIRIVAPGERLIIRLKTQARSGYSNLRVLCANVAGADVTLSPHVDGYDERRLWIPALAATSEPLQVPAQQHPDPALLDWTGPAPNRESAGVPGYEAGGIAGRQLHRKYRLPLEVTIQSVQPTQVDLEGKVVVELIVRNTGPDTYCLPISRNQKAVHATGNRLRRTFSLKLRNRFSDSRAIDTWAVVTSASSSVPVSFHCLAPSDHVAVRFDSDVPAYPGMSDGPRDDRVSIILDEWTLKDDQYTILATSEEIESKNEVTVTVSP